MSKPRSKPGDRIRLLIIIAIALLVIGYIIWVKLIKYEVLPRNLGVVKESMIYRSGQQTPKVLRELCTDLELKTIIDLGGEHLDQPNTIGEQQVAEELGITRYAYGLYGDGTGDPDKWASVLQVMADEDNHPLLVHCAAGAQRTTTAVLLYRHIIEGKPIRDVYAESFDYKHEADEWVLLAFLADHVANIETAYRTDVPFETESVASITEMTRAHQESGPKK